MKPGLLFKGWIDLQEAVIYRPAICVKNHLDDAKPFIHRVKQIVKPLLALTQSLLGLFLLRDVGISAKPPKYAASRILKRQHASQERTEYPIGSTQRKFHVKRLTSGNRQLPSFQDFRKHLRVMNTLPTPAFHLLRCSASILIPASVIPCNVAITGRPPRKVGDRISQGAELLLALIQCFLFLSKCHD